MNIHHIAIYYKNLEKAKTFYETYFSATCGEKYCNLKTGFSSFFLSFSNGSKLEIMSRNDLSEQSKKNIYENGYNHIAISLGTKQSVDEMYVRLKNDGFEIISPPRTTGDGYYECCFRDEENNIIEIVQ